MRELGQESFWSVCLFMFNVLCAAADVAAVDKSEKKVTTLSRLMPTFVVRGSAEEDSCDSRPVNTVVRSGV